MRSPTTMADAGKGRLAKAAGIAVISLLFAATSALAQIYTWKDENGRTVMSDQPPVGKSATRKMPTPQAPAASNAPAPKSFAEKEMDYRREQQERQEKSKKAEEEATQAKQRKENCDSARRNLQLYQSGERIARRNDSGEREFLDDEQRAAAAAKAQQRVNEWCR